MLSVLHGSCVFTHQSASQSHPPAGKFVEIDFDAGGRVTGASISTYLLER